ncbi:hypothetical protein JCM8097_001148 [Rhodosporidiobolus ruineniae]
MVLRRADSDSTNPDALFDVPSGLASFYSSVGTSGSLDCGDGVGLDTRSGGYKTNGQGKDGTRYCGDKADSPTYIWWESNMDVDCDGAPDGTSGICEGDGSYFDQTAFTDDSGSPIDAMSVQYVVVDQDDDFDATKFGVQALSAVAVICGEGGKMTFGVWADTNALGSMGEASVTLARSASGRASMATRGTTRRTCYIAFPGSKTDTVPSGSGSDEDALFSMGQALVSSVFGGDSSGSTAASSSSGGGGGGGATSKTSDEAVLPRPDPSLRIDSATKTADENPSTAASTGGGKAATTSKPATAASTTAPASSSISTTTSSDDDSTSSLSGLTANLSTTTLLLTLVAILLVAALITWYCIYRRHQLSYSPPPYHRRPHSARSKRHHRRRSPSPPSHPSDETDESSDGSDGSGSSGESSGSSGESDGEEEEKRRLYYQETKRRRKRG